MWNACLWHTPIIVPRPLISGEFVGDKNGKRFLVAIGMSYTSDFDIGLYAARPDGADAAKITRTAKGAVSNNKEMDAKYKAHMARNKTKFSIDDECGAYMKVDDLSLAAGRVRVSAKSKPGLPRPNQPSCGTRIAEYDFKSKAWSVVQDGGIKVRGK